MASFVLGKQSISSEFSNQKTRLLPFAYNITGDYLASEDIVQEVLNHFFIKPQTHIENPDSYLVRSVVNRAINHKKLLRTQKEQYLGPWLPSPILTEEEIYNQSDSQFILNYSLLVLMEQLNPKERAVFILKETFSFTHQEIAETLEIEADHSRQLLKRAKSRINLQQDFSPKEHDEQLIESLTKAILKADVNQVMEILHTDVVFHADGGNKISASRNSLYGQTDVYKLFQAIHSKYWYKNTQTHFRILNHKPAIVHIAEGKIYRCIIFEIAENQIKEVFTMVNPDKLEHLSL